MTEKFNTENIYKLEASKALQFFETPMNGLSSEEVANREHIYGKNLLKELKGKPLILVFLSHFSSLMAILLWVAGIISIVAGMLELGIAVWMVNVVNGIFGFWQEYKAGKAVDALKKMLPAYARVIRNGEEQKILAEDLVPGDVILLEEGDKISADARLLESNEMQVNQSALTGESNPVRKTSEPVLSDNLSHFEIPNLIFAGTSITNGTGKAIVVATGMETEFGKITDLTQQTEEVRSPLNKELDRLTGSVTAVAVGISIIIFLLQMFFVSSPVAKAFMFSLSILVAFVPEGLLPTVTLSLAMAVQRMAKQHALVKNLPAVETLGATGIICSDKTGTLTQNEMTVSNIWLPKGEYEVTGIGYGPEGEIKQDGKKARAREDDDLHRLLVGASLCSNARVIPPNDENKNYTVLGDPTEACLGVVAQKGGLKLDEIQNEAIRIRELPFDSRRKRMTTIHQLNHPFQNTKRIAFTKGAPKEVMELCKYIQKDGKVTEITEAERKSIMEGNDEYARNGLRVLAVAYRPITKETGLPKELSAYTPELVEKELTFVGLVVMADPPRPEVAEAVEQCHEASIRIIMITGDYGLTAVSIAKRIGIVKGDNPRLVTGVELEDMSDEELKEALADEIIFARMAPEQKYRIVCCLQDMGNIIAVTGDGVNDAPALKKADIGIAMGMAGTDVAKEAADMILTDDNFASIVHAVREGRAVYQNIRKFLVYILTSNMSTAVPSFAFLISKGIIYLPLTVMQILGVDLGTDLVPAIGLGVEQPDEEIMEQPPRDLKESLLNKDVFFKAFLWYGMIAGFIALGAYFFENMLNGWPNVPIARSGLVYAKATTITYGAIVMSQFGNVLNCRTDKTSVFKVGLFSNRQVMYGMIIEVLILMGLAYVPFLQRVFETAALGWKEWCFLVLIPIPIVLSEEIRKWFLRRKHIEAKGVV